MDIKQPPTYIPYDSQTRHIAQNISAPLVICRCCGTHIEPKWQLGCGNRVGHWLVTCDNESCPLCNYTFATDRYDDLDLAPYLESAGQLH